MRSRHENLFYSFSPSRVTCPPAMVVNPMNIHKILANVELSKASEYREAVQVKPQHVSLKLRVSKLIILL